MSPTLLTRIVRWSGAIAAAALACAALAGPTRILLDADLREQRVELLSMDGRRLAYIDATGRRRESPIESLVALLPDADRETDDASIPIGKRGRAALATSGGLVELTDGQRFPGVRAVAGATSEDALVWRHPRFGRLSLPIDRVLRALFSPEGLALLDVPGAAQGDRDLLLLSNGDAIAGFLVSVGDPIEIESDGQSVKAPAERVVALSVAAKREPMHGVVVWLDDGTVATLASIDAQSAESLTLRLEGGQEARYGLDSIEAVAFDATRIAPLGSIAPSSQAPVGERPAFEPARELRASPGRDAALDSPALGARDVLLPGPMRVTWTLPPGARRFAARAELPRDAWPWGDCEIVLSVGGAEAVRERLHMGRPTVDLSCETRGGEVTITVEPGNFGPINDRVILRRPIVLTGGQEG